MRVLFNILINDDNILEVDEIFGLTIDSLPSRVTGGTPRQSTIYINNDDGKYNMIVTVKHYDSCLHIDYY